MKIKYNAQLTLKDNISYNLVIEEEDIIQEEIDKCIYEQYYKENE